MFIKSSYPPPKKNESKVNQEIKKEEPVIQEIIQEEPVIAPSFKKKKKIIEDEQDDLIKILSDLEEDK